MKFIRILTFGITIISSCQDEIFPLSNRCGAPGITVYASGEFGNLFSNDSLKLSRGEINSSLDWDGKKIWFISNGMLNYEEENVLLQNCIVIQDEQSVEVEFRLADLHPTSFLQASDEHHFYSLNQGFIKGDTLEVIASLWRITGNGRYDYVHESVTVFRISLTSWVILSSRSITVDNDILFGSAMLRHNGYTYIYATKNATLDKDGFVARVPAGSLFHEWQYFDGYTWQPSVELIKPIFSGVSGYFSVFTDMGRFYLVSNGAVFGQEVSLYDADAPESGWRNLKVLYCRSEVDDDVIILNTLVHQINEGVLVCSYNRAPEDLEASAIFAPSFIEIANWK